VSLINFLFITKNLKKGSVEPSGRCHCLDQRDCTGRRAFFGGVAERSSGRRQRGPLAWPRVHTGAPHGLSPRS
jgi:hypothetical protein